ncbi:hypothetical protein DEIPH_ctg013orf0026 [Deinococcus phoenicis]|uniref:Uncharacterized protein n=1 Tax=Deinococcus phoenicis TaxID=1476583 RepID=A0A016QSN5_9DEIO|nr:hypothetical protein [Deinococcus phoenicis]EYB68922.1 hypothetical protein DEIPH_ctg013orf0026 [Deinococcus phoenicis]
MGGKAAEYARELERQAFEKTQAVQLPPTDPIRRAKVLDRVPAPKDTGAPNGTAGKADGADGGSIPGGASEGVPTPDSIPEVQPTSAQESRPAQPEGADEKPKAPRRPRPAKATE